jgi:hypothetical protein
MSTKQRVRSILMLKTRSIVLLEEKCEITLILNQLNHQFNQTLISEISILPELRM